MKVKYWGVRGSIATPTKANMGYGGNTTCIEVETDKGDHYIVDAGTGIRELGLDLMRRHQGKSFDAKLFMTHDHWDHIQGFPFFIPAYVPGNEFTVYSGSKKNKLDHAMDVKSTLGKLAQKAAKSNRVTEHLFNLQQSRYVFPVELTDMASKPKFVDLKEGEEIHNGLAASYKNFEYGHPDGMTSYKFTERGKTFIVQADFEHAAVLPKELRGASVFEKDQTAKMREDVINWWKGANCVYFDAQYLPEEYDPDSYGKPGVSKKTWGHSTYEKGIDFALEAGVDHLILGHHDPAHHDQALDELACRARRYLAQKSYGRQLQLSMAKEGLEHRVL